MTNSEHPRHESDSKKVAEILANQAYRCQLKLSDLTSYIGADLKRTLEIHYPSVEYNFNRLKLDTDQYLKPLKKEVDQQFSLYPEITDDSSLNNQKDNIEDINLSSLGCYAFINDIANNKRLELDRQLIADLRKRTYHDFMAQNLSEEQLNRLQAMADLRSKSAYIDNLTFGKSMRKIPGENIHNFMATLRAAIYQSLLNCRNTDGVRKKLGIKKSEVIVENFNANYLQAIDMTYGEVIAYIEIYHKDSSSISPHSIIGYARASAQRVKQNKLAGKLKPFKADQSYQDLEQQRIELQAILHELAPSN